MRRPAVGTLRREATPLGIPTSIGLHVLLVLAFALMPLPKPLRRLEEERVSVNILTPQQFGASTRPPPAPAPTIEATPTSQPPPPAPAQAAPPAKPAMVRATEMLSGKTLADPRSRQARADLATFASEERMVQLCNLEALDQIRKWKAEFQPEQVAPYATADETVKGTPIKAEGAAFRSRGKWYALKFNCELARDGESVVGFEFLVGGQIPRERWDELGLAAGLGAEVEKLAPNICADRPRGPMRRHCAGKQKILSRRTAGGGRRDFVSWNRIALPRVGQ